MGIEAAQGRLHRPGCRHGCRNGQTQAERSRLPLAGHSTERDFIYVTTQHLSADQLAQLSEEVGSERSLLVLCAAFRIPKHAAERHPNLTVKKIPKQVLSRCEWGHDDYSLKVENLPKATPAPTKTDKTGQQSLFGEEVGA